jgi:hypothetical protein
MRELRKWALAAAVSVAAAGAATAQTATISSTGGRSTGSIGGGAATNAGVGLGGGSSLGSSGGGGGGGGGSGSGGVGGTAVNGGVQLQQLQTMQAPTAPTGANTSSTASSNFLSGYYANPYYQGVSLGSGSSSNRTAQPGGFGQPLFGNTGTGTGGRGSLTSGGLGTTGGLGRTGGGLGGLGNQANTQSGILIPVQSQMAYTATIQFAAPPLAAGKLTSDIRAVIDTTPMIANARAVQVLTDAANNVTLRGPVKDDDEARLIEGLVRLTPGVGAIRNELTLAPATAVGSR